MSDSEPKRSGFSREKTRHFWSFVGVSRGRTITASRGNLILKWFLRAAPVCDLLLDPICRLYEIREALPSTADCIVGLAAGLCSDGSAGPMTQAVAERSASLHLNGLGGRLIFTGGCNANGITEAEAMSKIAITMGVPQERIFLEEESTRTHHHPARVEPILEKADAKSAIVVSQHLHARRARAIFLTYYGNRVELHFAKARSGFQLTSQRRYACQTSCLVWNVGTHLLAKLRRWA